MDSNKPTIFVIPGFWQKADSAYFKWIKTFLTNKGFNVRVAPIMWKRRVMSDYINDFKIYFKKNKAKENYFFGFSYGAVIAFSVASELKPKKIYLCSLSPDFKEDLPNMDNVSRRLLGKKRLKDIENRSAKGIARAISVPTILFYGEVESRKYPDIKKRAIETASLAKNAKAVFVCNAPHDINHPEYKKAIESQFK